MRVRTAAVVVLMLVALLAAGVVMAASPPAGSQLDQSYGPSPTQCGYIPDNGAWLAQTFTVGKSGTLAQADLYLDVSGHLTDYTLDVTRVKNGAPDLNSSLDSVPLDVTGSPRYVGWIPVTFSNLKVTAGKQYALVLRRPQDDVSLTDAIAWRGDWNYVPQSGASPWCGPGGYGGGDALVSDDPSFKPGVGDFYFDDYVIPTPVKATPPVGRHGSTAKGKTKKPPLCRKGQKSTKKHPCRKH